MIRNFVALLCLALAGGSGSAGEQPVPPLTVAADTTRALEKFEPAMEKLARARRKLEFVRAASAKPLGEDELAAVTVRLNDLTRDLDKARDDFRAVVVELRILALKCALTGRNNRHAVRFAAFADDVQRLVGDRDPKDAPHTKAVAALGALDVAVSNGEAADAKAVTAEEAVAAIQSRAGSVATAIGSEWATEQLIQLAREIRDRQARISADLANMHRDSTSVVFSKEPVIGAVQPLALAKKETATVKHTITWGLFEKDEFEVKLTASDPSLTVPAKLKLEFEKHEFRFEYEVKAGDKAGEFTVTLAPAAGNPVTVKVTVK